MIKHSNTFRLALCIFWVILFRSCKSGQTDSQTSVHGFNGFTWGTPTETIIKSVGRNPDEVRPDRVRYNKPVYEGVSGDRIAYLTPDNKLKSGTFFKYNAQQSAFDSLYTKFTSQYGKSTKDSEGASVWIVDKTKVILYLGEGTLMASAEEVP